MAIAQVNRERVESVLEQLEEWAALDDYEIAHGAADDCLCLLIETLCPEELKGRVDSALGTYRTMRKHFA